MVQNRIKLAGNLLLWLWLACFLGKTFYPHARSLYEGMRNPEHGWPARFKEHERLRDFVTLTSPIAATAHRRVLFAYGGNTTFLELARFFEATPYLLYPARPHATGELTTISHIAVYDTEEKTFQSLRFCHEAGEKGYLCQVRPADAPLQAYHVHVQYKAPDLTLTVRAIEPSQLAPAFLIFSIKESAFNVLLKKQSPIDNHIGIGDLYHMHLVIWETAFPVYQFRVLAVDERGLFLASEEYSLAFSHNE